MATLVLSTVGNAFGGPVGGAIGAMIGQSIDQQLLAPSRHGPRLGDLKVQGSAYGTQIPRMYGRMRVAGSVIWATDLTESSEMSGVKGQPDSTYSYSVSLAVALSSRQVRKIGRIWADGKLLRGAAGYFKVPTEFRFHPGSEDQAVDPLIASVEGLATTPAYRGLAIAVFENLELAEFGNRIPFMTFEVEADEDAPSIDAILNDASGDIVDCDMARKVVGYAAYGQSIRAAVEPLVQAYGIDLFDDGLRIGSPDAGAQTALRDEDYGCSADDRLEPRIRREQTPARNLPAVLRLGYYDPDLDYQSGEARATAGETRGSEMQRALPAAIAASDAKSLVQQTLAREWSRRDHLTLRLPPRFLGLAPGSVIEVDASPRRWAVEQCTIDGFAVVAELRPVWQPLANIAADAGRIVKGVDVPAEDMTIALFDMPGIFDAPSTAPALLIAASSPSPSWKSGAIEVVAGQQRFATQTCGRKSVLGKALNVLDAGSADLIDDAGVLEVELVDPEQWLVSYDDEALIGGRNLAILGSELLQFGSVEALGQGRFRLSRLLRGRGGTEWAIQGHEQGEPFALFERDALRSLPLPQWTVGSGLSASARNLSGSTSLSETILFGGEQLRPWSPVNLRGATGASGELVLSWTRRSRAGQAWIDGVDAPLGEASEKYRVTLRSAAASIEIETGEPALILSAAEIGALGGGPVAIEVCQIGDWAASRPAELILDL